MSSGAYLDSVGMIERRWPSAYDTVITRGCPNCGAGAMELCTNRITGRVRKMPCLLRETQGWD